MKPHRHSEDLRIKALERCRVRLEHDAELQRVAPSTEVRARVAAGGNSIRCLAAACELYADRPSFGERDFVVEEGRVRYLPSLRYLGYAELWGRIQAFASGLRHAGLVHGGELVGVCGFASVDWVVADLACLYLAAVSVPLQTTMTAADLGRIIAEAGLSSIVTSLEQLDLVAAAITAAPSVRSLVVMDLHEEDRARREAFGLAKQRIEEERGALAVVTMTEVERMGGERGVVPFVEPGAGDPLRTIVYTSGSTGSPKGAMFPESVWGQYWNGVWRGDLPLVPSVGVDYMPLNHMAGRGGVLRSLVNGGVMSFVLASDMSTLFEDIRIARPTWLFLVPRTASMIYQHFQTEVVKRGAGETEVMEAMRGSFLGDRLVYAVTGSAPTAPEVASFLERCFEVPVYDGYGSTEAGPITFEDRIVRENVIAWKLVDVPELGYLAADVPFPRGELCIQARRAIPGYYENPDATRELFDDEGYMRTGDVVEQRGPDEVAWIDRKKNVVKLAQGEFVSISRLEEVFRAGSPFLRQVYLHGSSLRSYLLAVVVPQGAQGTQATIDKARLRAELHRVAAREGLRGYEIPRDFIVETEPWSQENGLLTESNKLSRQRLRERYGERLEALYEAIEKSQVEDLHALGQAGGGARPVEEKIARALAVTLGLPEGEVLETTESFLALGGDSLGAVRLASLIEDLCGVAVPVGLVLDPTSSIRSLARYVEDRLAGKAPPRQVTFEEIHGAGADTVRAADLRIARFLSPDELEAAARAPAPDVQPSRVVLLTGANGFLGRFLLLELLEQVPREGGKVLALVRAPNAAAALERLTRSYGSVDPTLTKRFAALSADGRLEVVAGDLMKPRFGLPVERWEQLAGEVDTLVHNGALVNHAFPYAQLFEPNVLGAVEVMRLALLRRRKAVAFVSTVGVAGGLDRSDPIREDEDGEALWDRRPIDHGYAVGYGTSKWADEVLLRDLERRTGVPVAVLRCSMIMPPRSFIGQVNAGDFLTRLFYSVVVTGLAPRSFYADGARAPHFDGLPVDFVAHAIAAIGTERRGGFATYHVVNGHRDDGVSLDTMVDWIASAGYAVSRRDDHRTWFRAFRERLEALGPAEQQRSVLPILHRWETPLRGDLAFDNRRLRARLPGIEVPRIDAVFVDQYLKNMVYQRLIPHPGIAAAA
jgi:fatty acid CoA ligase FadD9